MNRPFRLTAVALSASLLAACGGGGGGDASDGGDLAPTAAILATSTESLALMTSGAARRITVSNQGGLPILALQPAATGLPEGSSMESNCPVQLAGGASCDLLITPGAIPTAAPGDLNPSAATVNVTSTNTPSVEVQVHVLAYGSKYQGGYVFALNDDTPSTSSIGGKVLTTQDILQAHWSPSALAIVGINENSLPGPDSCDGAVDGRCNTARILAQHASEDRNFAAAQCADSRQEGFSDWYLPALCEMGYDNEGIVNGICGTRNAPRVADNAQSRLYDSGPTFFFDVAYWSSTQSASNPATDAHMALYGVTRSTPARGKQQALLPSKCARHITP